MLIDMKIEHRMIYGILLREERQNRQLTQKEVIQKLPILSLRSYVQLENGKPLVESEIYDSLCRFFDIQYNYEIDNDSLIHQHLSYILQTYIYYDNEQLISCCEDFISFLTPYEQYAYEYRIKKAIHIFLTMNMEKRILTKQEYDELMTYYIMYPTLMQSLLASCIYYYQYQFPHNPTHLISLFQKYKHLHAPEHIRNVITYRSTRLHTI